ncbi:MAG TPA: D-alanyl-D-alanine carboxypeptidase [Xanthobacteraceae bacterium]|nr:D-alanyl-D-alanine carboxypeptidase [Xanthobacteraceae bacterium]
MFRVPDGAARRLRGGTYFAVSLALLAFTGAAADASTAKQTADIDSSRYAAIVVDANTKAVLRQVHADSLRHPASLTKVMTLYLLFERLESGRLKLTTPLPVSPEAAAQAPTKLGLKPGQTISVEDAIKALITKSANDVAVVVAEAIAGSEEEFAKLMTRKARALGMTHTVYRNASGLPDDEQVTTARDQAWLGIHIQERFPRYYRYFSLTRFTYRGVTMRNHNRLLGQVAGADGIKTGYTHASGFNLIASVRRNGRHIVAVVLGGASAAQRDSHMRGLIERHIVEASIRRPEIKIARAPAAAEFPAPSDDAPHPEPRAETRPAPQPDTRSAAQTELRAIPRIVIVPVVAPPTDAASIASPSSSESTAAESAPKVAPIAPVRAATLPLPIPQLNAFAPAPEAGPPALEATPLPNPAEAQPNPLEHSVTGNIGETIAEPNLRTVRTGRDGGWAIQVGAFEREDEARQRLLIARKKAAELLSSADPHTEKTTKGAKTYYRARFTGFDRAGAEAACKALQRADVACLALKI